MPTFFPSYCTHFISQLSNLLLFYFLDGCAGRFYWPSRQWPSRQWQQQHEFQEQRSSNGSLCLCWSPFCGCTSAASSSFGGAGIGDSANIGAAGARCSYGEKGIIFIEGGLHIREIWALIRIGLLVALAFIRGLSDGLARTLETVIERERESARLRTSTMTREKERKREREFSGGALVN